MKSENGISIKRILFFDFHIYQNEILNMNLISIINGIKFLNTNFSFPEKAAENEAGTE
tara:strand:- start:287 stop:460 length:174 start_codon:yes stop_codon:yes gene_type:complete